MKATDSVSPSRTRTIVAAAAATVIRQRRRSRSIRRCRAYQRGQRRVRQPEQRRLRHDEQHDDALGRDVPEVLSERQDPGRRQGLVDGAAGAHRGHRAVRSDVAARCARPRSISSRPSTATSRPSCKTSYDALAVYVHKDNPIEKLTLAQVEAIFGKSRRRGYKQNITTWGQLGLTGDWANRPISLYGRNSASGTYGFFKEHTLEERRLQGHRQGTAGLRVGRAGRHRRSLRHRLQRHRLPDVRRQDRAARRRPTRARSRTAATRTCTSGKYPLWRFLYIYVNKAPSRPLDPLVAEFVKLMYSKEGQEAVVKDGYMPLPAKQRAGRARQGHGGKSDRHGQRRTAALVVHGTSVSVRSRWPPRRSGSAV